MIPGICSVPKIESRNYINQNFHAKRYNGFFEPLKTHFLMKARFKILRLPLDLWHLKELESGLDFWFQSPVGLAYKSRWNSIWHFSLIKRVFWNFTERRHIIRWIKGNGMRITDSKSICCESALFDGKVTKKWRLHGKMCQFPDDFHRAKWA